MSGVRKLTKADVEILKRKLRKMLKSLRHTGLTLQQLNGYQKYAALAKQLTFSPLFPKEAKLVKEVWVLSSTLHEAILCYLKG